MIINNELDIHKNIVDLNVIFISKIDILVDKINNDFLLVINKLNIKKLRPYLIK